MNESLSNELRDALWKKNPDKAKQLVLKGAEIDMQILSAAMLYCDIEMVKFLHENGANIESEEGEYSPFMYAIYVNKPDLIEYFFKQNVNINTKDNRGMDALMLASNNGNDKLVELLIEKGANTKAIDKLGDTAMHYAARNGYSNVIKVLAEHGAPIDAKGHGDATPLDKAIENRRSDAVSLLKELMKRVPEEMDDFIEDRFMKIG